MDGLFCDLMWADPMKDDNAKNVPLKAHKEDVAVANGRKWRGAPTGGGGIDVEEKNS